MRCSTRLTAALLKMRGPRLARLFNDQPLLGVYVRHQRRPDFPYAYDRISMSLINAARGHYVRRPGRFRVAVSSSLLCSILVLACCGDGEHGRLEPIIGWDLDYTGDCIGSDFAATSGSATPDPTRCATPTDDGLIAVCWDQTTYVNAGMSGPWCTYKSRLSGNCDGGPNLGYVFRCDQPVTTGQ